MDKALLRGSLILFVQVPCRAGGWSALSGSMSGVRQARAVVVQTAAQWERLWDEHATGNPAPIPSVDFSREAVVAVFAGERRSGGFRIAVEVLEDPRTDAVTVLYNVRAPAAPDGMAISMMTQPFLFHKIAKPAGPILVRKAEGGDGKLVRPERKSSFTRLGAKVSGIQALERGVFAGP